MTPKFIFSRRNKQTGNLEETAGGSSLSPNLSSNSGQNLSPDSALAEPSQGEDWLADFEGQLAIDSYETDDELIIKAPVAGVGKDDLDIQVTDTQVTIRGNREDSHQLDADNFFLQECYWGTFSRTFELPFAVESKQAKASIKNGLLTIRLPKSETARGRKLKVESES